MRTIMSFPIYPEPPVSAPWATVTVELPQDAKILKVGNHSGVPMLWVIAEPKLPTVKRTFVALMEGDQIPDLADTHNYLGMWEQPGVYTFSWHLFEVR